MSILLFDKIDFRTLDFEFKGRSFKKELLKEVENSVSKYSKHTASKDIDPDNLIGVLCDFDTSVTDRDCDGCCDLNNRVICLNDYSHAIILHEVSHALQLRSGIFDFHDIQISDAIKVEQQAETIAYLLNLKLFNDNTPDLFKAYFCKEDHQFLLNWFGDFYQNDLNL